MSELDKPIEPFFDHSFVLTQFANDSDLVLTMLSKFATMAAQQLLEISTLSTTEELVRVVHNVKGSAGNLGFKRLSACAKQCEAELKTQGKLPELLNDELQQHIKQVIAFIIEQGSTNVEKSQGTDC